MSESIIQLIKKGEGLNIEFKRTIGNPYKIAKTLVSFANTSGGVLLVGVRDDGVITGVDSELKELEKLERAAGTLVEKSIVLVFKTESINGRNLLCVEIKESKEKPHFAVNEKNERVIYIRVKDKSIPTPKLLFSDTEGGDFAKLLASRHVKTLIQFLRENDSVDTRKFARMINISDKRADRLLHELSGKQVLLKIVRGKSEVFSLKFRE